MHGGARNKVQQSSRASKAAASRLPRSAFGDDEEEEDSDNSDDSESEESYAREGAAAAAAPAAFGDDLRQAAAANIIDLVSSDEEAVDLTDAEVAAAAAVAAPAAPAAPPRINRWERIQHLFAPMAAAAAAAPPPPAEAEAAAPPPPAQQQQQQLQPRPPQPRPQKRRQPRFDPRGIGLGAPIVDWDEDWGSDDGPPDNGSERSWHGSIHSDDDSVEERRRLKRKKRLRGKGLHGTLHGGGLTPEQQAAFQSLHQELWKVKGDIIDANQQIIRQHLGDGLAMQEHLNRSAALEALRLREAEIVKEMNFLDELDTTDEARLDDVAIARTNPNRRPFWIWQDRGPGPATPFLDDAREEYDSDEDHGVRRIVRRDAPEGADSPTVELNLTDDEAAAAAAPAGYRPGGGAQSHPSAGQKRPRGAGFIRKASGGAMGFSKEMRDMGVETEEDYERFQKWLEASNEEQFAAERAAKEAALANPQVDGVRPWKFIRLAGEAASYIPGLHSFGKAVSRGADIGERVAGGVLRGGTRTRNRVPIRVDQQTATQNMQRRETFEEVARRLREQERRAQEEQDRTGLVFPTRAAEHPQAERMLAALAEHARQAPVARPPPEAPVLALPADRLDRDAMRAARLARLAPPPPPFAGPVPRPLNPARANFMNMFLTGRVAVPELLRPAVDTDGEEDEDEVEEDEGAFGNVLREAAADMINPGPGAGGAGDPDDDGGDDGDGDESDEEEEEEDEPQPQPRRRRRRASPSPPFDDPRDEDYEFPDELALPRDRRQPGGRHRQQPNRFHDNPQWGPEGRRLARPPRVAPDRRPQPAGEAELDFDLPPPRGGALYGAGLTQKQQMILNSLRSCREEIKERKI